MQASLDIALVLDARYAMLPLIGVCKAAIRPRRQSAEGDDLQA